VEETDDILEVDARKRHSAKAPFEQPKGGKKGEFEGLPDKDQEAAS
jgi:hypothetical protein